MLCYLRALGDEADLWLCDREKNRRLGGEDAWLCLFRTF